MYIILYFVLINLGTSGKIKKSEENTERKTKREKTERTSFDKARKTTILFEKM